MTVVVHRRPEHAASMARLNDVGGDEAVPNEIISPNTRLSNIMHSYIDSLALRCAVELGIPDAILASSHPIPCSELQAKLSIPPSRSSYFRRLMRLLCQLGIFASSQNDDVGRREPFYSATGFSKFISKSGGGGGDGFVPLVLLSTDFSGFRAFMSMSKWIRDTGNAKTPFELAHGIGNWQYLCSDPNMLAIFNAAMAADNDSRLIASVVEKAEHVFHGLTSLVDVGGSTGGAAFAIVKAFPQIKCTVLDLPEVVSAVTEKGPVEFVGGSMFDHIPKANAVLLKRTLHDWGDEDCVRVLKRCREAIPAKEEGGKVIVVEMVVDVKNSQKQSARTQLHMDILMMACNGGQERDEGEWRRLFLKAGFSEYHISTISDTRAIIEVFP